MAARHRDHSILWNCYDGCRRRRRYLQCHRRILGLQRTRHVAGYGKTDRLGAGPDVLDRKEHTGRDPDRASGKIHRFQPVASCDETQVLQRDLGLDLVIPRSACANENIALPREGPLGGQKKNNLAIRRRGDPGRLDVGFHLTDFQRNAGQ